jgi:predicted nucleic acid-binding protein
MKKLKIYLDSSIISHLYAEDAPDKMRITEEFWREIEEGLYEAVISSFVIVELGKCQEPKRSLMLNKLQQSNIIELDVDEEAAYLASKYIEHGVLSEKHYEDAFHIAAATVSKCQVLASWNFKHIVKVKTILGTNGINRVEGYEEIQLLSPDALVEEGDE